MTGGDGRGRGVPPAGMGPRTAGAGKATPATAVRGGPPPPRRLGGTGAVAPPPIAPGGPMSALPDSALAPRPLWTERERDVRKVAPPKARDTRLDRRVPKNDPHWLFVMLPTDPSRPVERVQLPARQLRRWKMLASAASVLVVVLGVALFISLPSSLAYSSLRSENLDLKQRLEAVDRKMAEVDRMILRLRLYDAQLEGLSAPIGDHGPLPDEAMANAGAIEEDPFEGGDDLDPEGAMEEGDFAGDLEPDGEDWGDAPAGAEDEGIRSAAEWADGIVSRAQDFLDLFSRSEGQFNSLMEQMEQMESLEQALPSLWPANGPMNSGYGWRRNPFGRTKWKHHSGLDVGGKVGSPIYAAASGTILRTGWFGGYGRAIEISHGYGVTTLYGHCSELLVQPGQEVERGAQIALMGSTGRSTGPHLHFEVRHDHHPVDPLLYLDVPAFAKRKVRTRAVLPPGAIPEGSETTSEDDHEE